MKMVMITAPESNSGKTLASVSIIRALKNRGMDVSAFKSGPDFVDRKYIALASRKRAGNMDMHMMGEEGISHGIGMNKGEFGVVEGVMGYFDGMYNTYENSSYDISRKLDIPAVLVYSPKGEMFTIIPKIKGMVDFSKNRIKGIILNKTSKTMYMLLKEQIEKYVDIKVLGFLPYEDSMKIHSRSLGLLQPDEIDALEGIMDKGAHRVEEHIDLDEFIEMGNEVEVQPYQYPLKTNLTVAIAYDEAFNFYYQENIKLFESMSKVQYFSPLRDEKLPKADLVYIGGGYPELFKNELSSNEKMINSIRNFAQDGGHIYGEGGGLMYLSESIDGKEMCNIIDGKAIMTHRLQNFGYTNIQMEEDTILGQKGDTLTAQEFHKSILETKMEGVLSLTKPMTKRKSKCGYQYKNVLGIYQHINFLGNMKSLNHLLEEIQRKRVKKDVYKESNGN